MVFLYTPIDKLPSTQASMEGPFLLILDACKKARELETNLQSIGDEPDYLLSSCEGIVEAFVKAIHALRRPIPSNQPTAAQLNFSEALRSPVDFGSGEGPSWGGGDIRTVDFVHARGFDGSYFSQGTPETEVLLGDQVPELSTKLLEFGMDTGAPAAGGVVGGKASETEGSMGPSTHGTSRRKRKDSTTSYSTRIPVPRTGNTEVPPDDGYTWRKYGQKPILGSRFPRSYYRCTHKSFYGCNAKKKLQRLDDDPFKYEATYYGDHTCQTSTAPLIIAPNPPTNYNHQGESVLFAVPPLSTSIQLRSWRSVEKSEVGRGETGRDADFSMVDLADLDVQFGMWRE